jgi:glucan phosphoethanolaminetransferase (alkaline phosphatase superfamily)
VPQNVDEVICDYNVTNANMVDAVLNMKANLCSPVLYETRNVLNRCVPSGDLSVALKLAAENLPADSGSAETITALLIWGKDAARILVQDAATTWQYILGALGATLVVCFIWLLVLRFFGGFITVLALLGSELVLGGFAYYTYTVWQTKLAKYNQNLTLKTATTQQKTESDIAMALFIICACFAGIFLIIMIALRKRIRIAIRILKEASIAVGSIPSVVLFPIVTFISLLCVTAFCVIVAAFIETAPDTTSLSTIGVSESIAYLKYFHWYV